MAGASQEPTSDQAPIDGLIILKDASNKDEKSIADTQAGLQAQRFVIVDRYEDDEGIRHVARDDCDKGRYNIAKLQHVTVTYRRHRPGDRKQEESLSEDYAVEIGKVTDWEKGLHDPKGNYEPSNVHSENRSTLTWDQNRGEDKKPDFHFGREHDTVRVVSTQKIKTTVKVCKWDGKQFKETAESREDGVYKKAWNITPVDQPFKDKKLDQKNEENGGPGEHGFAAHDYIKGYPTTSTRTPEHLFQGGWIYDGRADEQGSLALITDIIGIDGREVKTSKLPRYKTKPEGKLKKSMHVGIAYLRHDAHFQKVSDKEDVPPVGKGKRMSGRLFFTKEFGCPETPEADPNNDIPDSEETGTPICGEFVFDGKKANHPDSKIQHEGGEWRPKVLVPSGGGGNVTYDYSWHHAPPPGAYGYGYGQGTVGIPMIPVVEDPPSPQPQQPKQPPNWESPGGMPNPNDVINPPTDPLDPNYSQQTTPKLTPTEQAQWGWAPPNSPGFSQRVNILKRRVNPVTVNTVGTFMITKPSGFTTVTVEVVVSVSDSIQPNNGIWFVVAVGEFSNDEGPIGNIQNRSFVLTPADNLSPGVYKRVSATFTGFQPQRRTLMAWVERRNDILPQDPAELWTLRHISTFGV